MLGVYNQFKDNIKQVNELGALYTHLKDTLHLPNDLSDILRSQWVYTISAFDKLIHDLVRVGMIRSFLGVRPTTPQYLSFTVSLETQSNIASAIAGAAALPVPPFPPEYWLEREIIQKHKLLSFQDPGKISEGLNLIWGLDHKWANLAATLGIPEKDLKNQLRAIVTRRNQIVHEADIDPSSGVKTVVEKGDVDDVISLISGLGEAIYNAVV